MQYMTLQGIDDERTAAAQILAMRQALDEVEVEAAALDRKLRSTRREANERLERLLRREGEYEARFGRRCPEET